MRESTTQRTSVKPHAIDKGWGTVIGYTVSTAVTAGVLWWMINRSSVRNDVGLLEGLFWPLSDMYVVIAIGAIAGLVKGVRRRSQQAQREANIIELSRQLDFTYRPTVDRSELPAITAFANWSNGRNRMTGEIHGTSVEMFDLTTVEDSGETRSTSHGTVILLPAAGLPGFSLFPRAGFLRRLGMLGITFDPDSAEPGDASTVERFGTLFLLTTESSFQPNGSQKAEDPQAEQSLRELFTPEMMRILIRYPGWSIQSNDGWLVISLAKGFATASQRQALLDGASAIHDAFLHCTTMREPSKVLRRIPGTGRQQQAKRAVGALIGAFPGFFLGGSMGTAVVFSSDWAPGGLVSLLFFPGGPLLGLVLGAWLGSRLPIRNPRAAFFGMLIGLILGFLTGGFVSMFLTDVQDVGSKAHTLIFFSSPGIGSACFAIGGALLASFLFRSS